MPNVGTAAMPRDACIGTCDSDPEFCNAVMYTKSTGVCNFKMIAEAQAGELNGKYDSIRRCEPGVDTVMYIYP